MFSWFRRRQTPEPARQEWLVVLATDNISEAHIVAGRLQYEGIPAWVHQQPGATGLGITVGLLGEIRVLVNAEDYAAARQIIETDVTLELEADNQSVRYILPDEEDFDEGDDKVDR